jgi:hypothetical protein
MKRIVIVSIPIIFTVILGVFLSLHLWVREDVKEKISLAKQKYSGNTEEALIAYLLDESNSAIKRSHIAVWTLGQIQSQNALPVLHTFYKHDSEGKTCVGYLHEVLCQRELHKAISAIERRRLFAFSRLK